MSTKEIKNKEKMKHKNKEHEKDKGIKLIETFIDNKKIRVVKEIRIVLQINTVFFVILCVAIPKYILT